MKRINGTRTMITISINGSNVICACLRVLFRLI